MRICYAPIIQKGFDNNYFAREKLFLGEAGEKFEIKEKPASMICDIDKWYGTFIQKERHIEGYLVKCL